MPAIARPGTARPIAVPIAVPIAAPAGAPDLEALVAEARHTATVTLGQVHDRRRDTHARPPRRGRLNIENVGKLKAAGFPVGTRIRVVCRPGMVEIVPDPEGSIVIAPKTMPRRGGEAVVGERLDVRSAALADCFPDQDRLLVLYLQGRLVVLHLPTVAAQHRRAAQLLAAVERRALEVGSLYAGVGTLDAALHEGLEAEGFGATTAFVNDAWEDALDAYRQDNPAGQPATRTHALGIEELIALGGPDGRLPRVTLAVAGIPCKGASRLNVRDRTAPEFHPFAGHQVLNAVLAFQRMGWPPLLLVENVLAWADTASCAMLRRVLHEQGYQTALLGDVDAGGAYRGLNSLDYGTIDRRVRMALLAYPAGVRLEALVLEKTGPSPKTVGEIRLPEHQVDPKEYDKGAHLFRAEKAAKGWRTRVIPDDARETPTLSATCWKQQIEAPRLMSPADPTKTRLPLPEEHAALKGHDPKLVASLAHDTKAHTALGNGTAKGPWVALGRALARWLVAIEADLRALVRREARDDAARRLTGPAPVAADTDLPLFAAD